jgi:hypothetical protein
MHRLPNDAAPCRVPDRIALDPQAPIILAYGIGVDPPRFSSSFTRAAKRPISSSPLTLGPKSPIPMNIRR